MNAVKAIGDYTLKGRGIVYGGQDLAGDTFTRDTDLGDTRSFVGMPVYYDHSLGGIKSQIGTVKAWMPDDEGIDVEIELDRRHKYAKEVMKLVNSGALGLSTGALSHLVVREAGELKRWVVGEISLTPTPAEPRTVTEVKSEEGTVSSHADTTPKPDDTHQTIISKESDTMSDIKDAVKQAISELAGEPVQGGVIAAPSTKSVTTRGFSNEPTEALKHWIATGDTIAAKATLVEGTNNNGGFLVPKDFYDRIIARRDELSLLSQVPLMRLTTSRRQIDVPAVSAQSSSAYVAESGAANFSEPTFANTKTITIFRNNISMKMSNELLSDQAANLEQFVTEHIAARFAVAVNNQVLAGTGTNEAWGVLARATQSETAASATTIDASDVINLQHKIPSQYATLGQTAFAMRNSTLGYIRGLTGNWFQFQPTPQGNGRDISGYPVIVSDAIGAIATTVKSVVFGNFSYYCFVENGSIEISRNPYLYQANNETAIFADYRFGGDVIQPEAFAYIVQP
jgi:HK97 family phage major capsid protein